MCEMVLLGPSKVEELVNDQDIGYVANLATISNIRIQDTLSSAHEEILCAKARRVKQLARLL
jgi:hypothetical protein